MPITHNMLRLLECFKSITFMLPDEDDRRIDLITVDDIANWIKFYNGWYITVTGMEDEKHPYLAYGREIEITGSCAFLVNEQLEKIYRASYECGFLLRLNLALCDLTPENSAFLVLLAKSSGIALNVHASINIVKEESFALLETLASENILLSFVGSHSFWSELGVLSSQIINKRLYRIIPLNLHEKRSLDTFNPCANRFHIFVDEYGGIYPCRGLLGIAEFSIGTIYDDVSKIRILDANYPLDLNSLEMRGPELINTNCIKGKGLLSSQPMPLVCHMHRIQVTSP